MSDKPAPEEPDFTWLHGGDPYPLPEHLRPADDKAKDKPKGDAK